MLMRVFSGILTNMSKKKKKRKKKKNKKKLTIIKLNNIDENFH